jgi:Cytochrome P460
VVSIAVVLAVVVGGSAMSAQDKYSLQLPNGLAFSEFRGYENWRVVSVSQTADLLKVEVANPTMIDAYRAGIPGKGKPFPDGSKIAKIEREPKKMVESPFAVNVPDTLQDAFFIDKGQQAVPGHQGMGLRGV